MLKGTRSNIQSFRRVKHFCLKLWLKISFKGSFNFTKAVKLSEARQVSFLHHIPLRTIVAVFSRLDLWVHQSLEYRNFDTWQFQIKWIPQVPIQCSSWHGRWQVFASVDHLVVRDCKLFLILNLKRLVNALQYYMFFFSYGKITRSCIIQALLLK